MAAIINSGLTSAGNPMVLDIPNGNAVAGQILQVYPQNFPYTDNQLWYVNTGISSFPDPDWVFIASRQNSNLVLDVLGGHGGQVVQLWPKKTVADPTVENQLWSFRSGRLISKMPGPNGQTLVLDVPNSDRTLGLRVFPQWNNLTPNQTFASQAGPVPVAVNFQPSGIVFGQQGFLVPGYSSPFEFKMATCLTSAPSDAIVKAYISGQQSQFTVEELYTYEAVEVPNNPDDRGNVDDRPQPVHGGKPRPKTKLSSDGGTHFVDSIVARSSGAEGLTVKKGQNVRVWVSVVCLSQLQVEGLRAPLTGTLVIDGTGWEPVRVPLTANYAYVD